MKRSKTLEQLQKIMNNRTMKFKKIYQELRTTFGYKYMIGLNGYGETVLEDISNHQKLAKGVKECQAKMLELLGK